ncbi:MAG: copper-containing nitrite reductase [Alphaproteobacteria bacterium]
MATKNGLGVVHAMVFLTGLLVATGWAAQLTAQTPTGEAVFRKCQACHSLDPTIKKVGPTLAGVVGRRAGTLPDFRFSDALKNSGLVWGEQTLDAYLENPSKLVPGTRMTFGGLKRPEDRAAVIAFLAGLAQAEATTVPETAPASDAPAMIDMAVPAGYIANVKYTLRTGIADGRMVFIGFGGAIDGLVNPELAAVEGDVVQITLINGEGAEHDIVLGESVVTSQHVVGKGSSTTVAFRAKSAGTLWYFCSLPGHRQAGMEGRVAIKATPTAPAASAAPTIAMDPTNLPPPIGERLPQHVRVELEAIELAGQLADGTTYTYWTFNGTVPGPFLRVRVGDTVEVIMKNDPDATMVHSVDFHAATGPGGGAVYLQVEPGGEKRLDFKALVPGIYVYHCATPMVAHHIANGMYGLILVEPEGGLPPVDREFYVMQGEIYTAAPFGEHGSQEFSVDKLLAEAPEYFIFNGAVGALTQHYPLHAAVGETVRLYMGVGGPNVTSSFHVIGEIFDRVYAWGDLITPPAEGVQTVLVAPGGAVVTDFKLDVPGRYLLVDHALSRLERGLVGFLIAEGEPNEEIYKPYSEGDASGH